MSSSSFEVSRLPEATKTRGPKEKHSVLGFLGLDLQTTIRLPTVCTASTASSNIVPATDRLSVNPATMMGRN